MTAYSKTSATSSRRDEAKPAPRASPTAITNSSSISLGRRETYRGEVTIRFASTGRDGPLPGLPRKDDRAARSQQHGRPEPTWTGYRLNDPGALLRPRTRSTSSYENDYDHTGDGFHQFKDPEDGEEYLYSNFEPYEAHRLFPCFDQPDIKATLRADGRRPRRSGRSSRTRARRARRRRATAAAGTSSSDEAVQHLPVRPHRRAVRRRSDDVHDGIELGLYCRKSLRQAPRYATRSSRSSQAGPRLLRGVLRLPLPVRQVRPGLRARIQRRRHGERRARSPTTSTWSSATRRPRTSAAAAPKSILHEMAHMWFGDLVTMRWWNDLWLNESVRHLHGLPLPRQRDPLRRPPGKTSTRA